MVALRIAQEKKLHTIAENLILPCCKDIVHCVLGDSAEKKLASLPLSNDTIKRRIRDMADDVEQQVVAEILGAPLNTFSIKLDESTDVSSCAQLLVFARYIKDGDFKEEFLFVSTWRHLRKEKISFSRSLIISKRWDYPRRTFLLAQQMVHMLC